MIKTIFLSLLFVVIPPLVFAQQEQEVSLKEINSSSFSVSTSKTFHLVFPNEVKYFSIGDEMVAGERVTECPNLIRLKAIVPSFNGLTNMSVVTADGEYYSYNISFAQELEKSYLMVGKEYKQPPLISVNDNQQTHLIFPDQIIYADYGSSDLEVVKASGVDNILAVRALTPFQKETNLTVVTFSKQFYTFNLKYTDTPVDLSFVVDPGTAHANNNRVALLDNKELNTVQREQLRKDINARFASINKLNKDYAGIKFSIINIFIDRDILFFKFRLTNYSNIDYVPDFIRFYIQDSKVKKKTAVQQIEQVPLFMFDFPERVSSHVSTTFTVALNKFTIPDKKKLIIELQELSGGRHFMYKLDNKPIISAEILYPKKGKLTLPNSNNFY